MNTKLILGVSLAALLLAGCEVPRQQPTAREVQSNKATQAANNVMANVNQNAEINNIASRLKLTSDPALLGHITLVNKVGQVVMYATIKGKVTSGGKRLTPPWSIRSANGGEHYVDQVVEGPSDEGTYGSSNPYIYFTTTDGAYVQTSLDYVYSDQPIRLDTKPLMVVGK